MLDASGLQILFQEVKRNSLAPFLPYQFFEGLWRAFSGYHPILDENTGIAFPGQLEVQFNFVSFKWRDAEDKQVTHVNSPK